MTEEINSSGYINEILEGHSETSSRNNFILSLKLASKTLFYGRKWIIYLILGMFPIIFSLLSSEKLLGFDNGLDAFARQEMEVLFVFLFSFGALFISLPNTSDEISDNVMVTYVVRPIKRSTLYLSKTTMNILGIWIVNSLIVTIYYVYFGMIVGSATLNLNDSKYLLISYVLILFGSLIYGAVFTLVGMIGEKGFTLGIFLALFETFIVNLLFLQDNEYLPRTHLNNLADEWLYPHFSYSGTNLGIGDNIIYFILFTSIIILSGVYYFKNREFNE